MATTPAGSSRDWVGDFLFAIAGIVGPLALTAFGVSVWVAITLALVVTAGLLWKRFALPAIWGGSMLLIALVLFSAALLLQSFRPQYRYQICYEPDWVAVAQGYSLDGITVGVRVINEGRRFWAGPPEVDVEFDNNDRLPSQLTEALPLDRGGNDLLAAGTVDLPRSIGGNGPIPGRFRVEVPLGPSKDKLDSEPLIVSGTFVARLTQGLKRVSFEYTLDPGTNTANLITKPCRLSALTM